MGYNANVDGWLKVKGDRYITKLEEIKQYSIEEHVSLTTSELVDFITGLQRYVAREFNYARA